MYDIRCLKKNISSSIEKKLRQSGIGANIRVLDNNRGMTLIELITTFALLGLFMVAATRVISYVIGIYYGAKGATNGLIVSNMITNKIVGQIENASEKDFQIEGDETIYHYPVIIDNAGGDGIDKLWLVDGTGSTVAYEVNNATKVLNIHYKATADYTGGEEGYAATDWYFDSDAYMGYTISRFDFSKAGAGYPDNVLKFELEISSPKYGEYESTYYIKCINLSEPDVDEMGIIVK